MQGTPALEETMTAQRGSRGIALHFISSNPQSVDRIVEN